MTIGGWCVAESIIVEYVAVAVDASVAIEAAEAVLAVATADSPLSHMVGLLFTTLLTTLLHG